jgi:hypothetical protein
VSRSEYPATGEVLPVGKGRVVKSPDAARAAQAKGSGSRIAILTIGQPCLALHLPRTPHRVTLCPGCDDAFCVAERHCRIA